MILWLASYPKSGNTWMRALLSSYLFEKYFKRNQDIFSKMKLIKRFPEKSAFNGLVNEEILKNNKLEAFKYFIKAQEKINQDPKLHIIKTHNFCGAIEGSNFTDKYNTAGSIYVVRDPRAVAVSYAYYSNISFEKSVELMLSNNRISFNDKYYPEARLSWKTHLLSWESYPAPRHVIKYEDLLENSASILKSTLVFINQFIKDKIIIDENKISKVAEECSFKNLKRLEDKKTFDEIKKNKNDKEFFRKGLKDDWKNELSPKLIYEIEKNFKEEMKNLNYI